MRLTFERDGGFAPVPSLSRSLLIDTDELPHGEAEHWRQLVDDANPWEAAAAPPARAGADRRTYRLAIEDGSRRVSLALHDPLPAALRPLVRALESQLKAGH